MLSVCSTEEVLTRRARKRRAKGENEDGAMLGVRVRAASRNVTDWRTLDDRDPGGCRKGDHEYECIIERPISASYGGSFKPFGDMQLVDRKMFLI